MATSHILAEPNDENLEAFSVFWLDAAINDTKFVNAQHQIRKSIHYLKTFIKVDDCEKYIKSMNTDDRIVLVVGSSFGRILVPRIHQLRQVWSIYIFSGNKKNEEWVKHFSKVSQLHCIFINRKELA